MGLLPGRADAIRGMAALLGGTVLYAVVVTLPFGTGPTELLWDLLGTLALFGTPIVVLYYWVSQPRSE
ncbi:MULTISPECIES: hypothetical protein [Halorussus]|uniref:hypothetical protein n=1 Tax=Halorussus TaxID=1070314 RepID=UPI000E216811|nr:MULTISPECIES: hypothetical protein [Halorussus]NHN58045.1 hypothetical protein [Halorussus sp. JP-T4]